ncbi:DUF4351 domain-containing protein [Acaryochloris sp. IP29b_bin.137]|uniref:DUF4351 domain-containing protein n=1 Tax=Acaryochloris sp. IP29b_bin.137 TaxID=2969217 RepID=UPI0026117EF3|nr:DUF4351 domain-containing protein [Acaryochloris sp. IP29b_bin.137]
MTLVLPKLDYKFGELSPEVIARIQSLAFNQIEALCKALLELDRIDDLVAWIACLENSRISTG